MDLIFVSLENWDEIWRRNQFLCAEFIKSDPSTRILFVGLARDVSNRVRRGKLAGLFADETVSIPELPAITFTRPIKLLPNSIPTFRRINERAFRNHVKKQAQKLGFVKPVLWLNPHSAVHMVGQTGESAVIYDITDDWTTLTQSETLRQLTIAQDAELCSKADAVIVCSERLYEMKTSMAKSLHLVPNGVDAEHYRSVTDKSAPLPPEAKEWQHPVFGYTGTIHRDRVDVALVEKMATSMSQGSIALVGPCHLSAEEQARLVGTGRVHITGGVPYRRIPEFMRAFDVSITPHMVTPFTESLNPIKLWEYLAAGKPVVSTPVAGFRDYPQYVRIASTPEDFLKQCLDALDEDTAQIANRRAEAAKHSWESRAETVIGVMREAKATRYKASK
jgi:teichuronic acid biosynthesis glycosyltransferase TuaH